MLDRKGFDLWADGYDASVRLSEESDAYPFAGYKRVLGYIFAKIMEAGSRRVLDVGFGTAVLAKRLYDVGIEICGVDFSARMIEIAREKMPGATLLQHDFARGMPDSLSGERFDAVVCTYAIHHLNAAQKERFILWARAHLLPGGCVLIGDVAFETADELAACRQQAADAWDESEIYPVLEELRGAFPDARFKRCSHCAGVITIGG